MFNILDIELKIYCTFLLATQRNEARH